MKCQWLTPLLISAAVLSGGDAAASTIRATGGMGLTIWPMQLRLGDHSHDGIGLGISGRVMARLWDHLRLQAGLLQGEFEEADQSKAKRSFIFGAVEAQLPLFLDAYALFGARAGGSHLVLVQTEERLDDNRRRVRDLDRWTPLVEPTAALGYLLVDKFHLEIECGVALDYADGALHTSYTIVLGIYFRMWDSGW
ncbi:MAG: hypothetical protein JXR83_03900 [Deltaproteobacteria bacterium]|nr:hypothetical protein [Deltaproteobacteria bacterium]